LSVLLDQINPGPWPGDLLSYAAATALIPAYSPFGGLRRERRIVFLGFLDETLTKTGLTGLGIVNTGSTLGFTGVFL